MTAKTLFAVALVLPVLASCAGYEPAPSNALDVSCDTGGRHGPTGVLDWHCVDGDGEERLRPQPLHEVIAGAPIEEDDDG